MLGTPKTKLLSLIDPYLKEFSATVLIRQSTEVGESLILDKTAFHPQGGGQDSDAGFIAGLKGRVKVADVREFDGVIHHMIEGEEGRIEVGDTVRGEIDWVRRYGLMRNHTASHVLWSALERALPGMKILGSAVRADGGRFDVQVDREQIKEKTAEIELVANTIVEEDRPIGIDTMSREDALQVLSKYGETPQSIPEETSAVRVIDIEGWDISACKGLHVKSTGEVGSIKILRRISKGKNLDRIEFTAI